MYNSHRNRAEPGTKYGTFQPASGETGPHDPAYMGSPYVPLDNWVYTAIERLAALGYIDSAFMGMRPWTRMECARLVGDIALADSHRDPASGSVAVVIESLRTEFATELGRWKGDRNLEAALDEVYFRFAGVSGRPLNDSFHFGQTFINDYGRPFQEGGNVITGFAGHAEAGPLALYANVEYQHSPSAAGYPASVLSAIAFIDQTPLLAESRIAARNEARVLDAYLALNIGHNQISFGQQSLWWGPGSGTALMFSNNAVPVTMLRLTRTAPFTLPSILRWLGPVRTEMFIGRLQGHHYPSGPFVSAQKVSFKPTPNLELGFSKLTVFAGGSTPITWANFYRATFSADDRPGSNVFLTDPGDRRSGFNFSYRLPKLRNYVTLYLDSLADDDPSPLAAPRRAAINPGIYVARIPGLEKLDFRAEAVSTDPPGNRGPGGQFFYYNGNFRDSHTNDGQIMGSWVGRDGRGYQASSTYWWTPRTRINVGYRKATINSKFIPGGGSINDVSTRSTFNLGALLQLETFLQYERWKVPLLSPAAETNFSASVKLTYRPRWAAGR